MKRFKLFDEGQLLFESDSINEMAEIIRDGMPPQGTVVDAETLIDNIADMLDSEGYIMKNEFEITNNGVKFQGAPAYSFCIGFIDIEMVGQTVTVSIEPANDSYSFNEKLEIEYEVGEEEQVISEVLDFVDSKFFIERDDL